MEYKFAHLRAQLIVILIKEDYADITHSLSLKKKFIKIKKKIERRESCSLSILEYAFRYLAFSYKSKYYTLIN